MASRFGSAFYSPIDGNGNPYPSGVIRFYTVGTTTPLNVYSSLTTQNSTTLLGTSITANGDGLFPICYLAVDSYRAQLTTSSGVVVSTQDLYSSSSTLGTGDVLEANIATGAVTATKIGTGAVTSDKILDGTIATVDLGSNVVTGAKIGTGANGVATTNIVDLAVTGAKIAATTIAGANIVSGDIGATQLGTNSVTTVKVTDANITAAKLDGAQSGSAPIFGIRAWCTFDGTLAASNVPTAGGNVSSVTRDSTGLYTINFTTAMADTNYAVICGCNANNLGTGQTMTAMVQSTATGTAPTLKSTTQVQIATGTTAATYALYDLKQIWVMIIR